jgi:signal transduction histidine kinase
VRAKPSFTATGMYSCTDLFPFLPPNHATAAPAQAGGLLHDARNLIGTLGLYCDLLSMPDVLKPEHRQYADDLRLVGTRSGALIQHLIEQIGLLPERRNADSIAAKPVSAQAKDLRPAWFDAQIEALTSPEGPHGTVSLRRVVDRCSSLLSRVAGGRAIEVSYGEAATMPVCIGEEAAERILVNLVRNAATALGESSSAIRIGVGSLVDRVGEARPWPFRWVKITVEDSGCGMTPSELEKLLSSSRAVSPEGHGIGFGVVQQLVAASGGELRIMSTPDLGTRVQIDWPVACISSARKSKISSTSPQPSDVSRFSADRLASAERSVSC